MSLVAMKDGVNIIHHPPFPKTDLRGQLHFDRFEHLGMRQAAHLCLQSPTLQSQAFSIHSCRHLKSPAKNRPSTPALLSAPVAHAFDLWRMGTVNPQIAYRRSA
jgi:hypothetical protein